MDLNAILFVIGMIAILSAVILLLFKPYEYGASIQHFKKITDDDDKTDVSADTRYRSVRVRPGLMSCERVASISGEVFLSREAPELPLPNCTEANCTCHYIFDEDRRCGLDRRAELAKLRKKLLPEFDRRRSPGRRDSDLLAV